MKRQPDVTGAAPDEREPSAGIYMDHHATTPLDHRVLDAMMPYFRENYGNPASRSHARGWRARDATEQARREVASLIGARPKEIVFTSGATESNNMAIKGVAGGRGPMHIITLGTEHAAVLDVCHDLTSRGIDVTVLPVDRDGYVDPGDVDAAIRTETGLVSIMLANNEIGVLQPIAEIAEQCRARGVLVHCDAAQAVGRIPVNVRRLGVDLMSISAHKMYGPKGVGALYIRRRLPRLELTPLLHGGGHEAGRRAGTLNVPAIVGFGAASRLAQGRVSTEVERISALRDRLLHHIWDRLEDVHVNGGTARRLPGNLNVSFGGVRGTSLLSDICDDVAVSSGAACAGQERSHVLRALGVDDELAQATIRFGLGVHNTIAEVDHVADLVVRTVTRLRSRDGAPSR